VVKRVLIIGGGSGGTILANSLDRRRFDVTLVSASQEHLFQPALLYVAFNNAKPNVIRDERDLLRRHVKFVYDRVTHVNLTDRSATTAGGAQLAYDDVVIATGICTDPSQIPGLSEVNAQFGDYHSSLAQAQLLWSQLDMFRGGTIALGQSSPICKCPPSPVEGILLTDQLLRKRRLRDRTRLVFFGPYPRAYPAAPMNDIVEPILRERGIEVMTFFDVDRIDATTQTISSIEGDEICYDLPIVIPPFVGMDITYEPADVLDESRFIATDRLTLRVVGSDTAFAIGDATNLPTSKSGVGAHLEAKVVADALSGKHVAYAGRTHCPLDVGDGRATFVIGSYNAPVKKSPPTRLKHLMKMMFGRIYWLSLRGWLDPVFDVYFKLTEPRPPKDRSAPHVPAGRS